MRRAAFPEALNGGYIEEYGFDMRQNIVTMRVDVLDNGMLSSYDVRFERVSHLLYETESTSVSADDRLQVTELYIDEAPEDSKTEEWQVTISMWDTSHLTIRCSSITVDGLSLQ